MKSKVVYNQKFNKSVSDVKSILKEFEKIMNGNYPAEDKKVKIEPLKNEFKTAMNSVLEEVEDTTGENAATILIELSRSDLYTLWYSISAKVDISPDKKMPSPSEWIEERIAKGDISAEDLDESFYKVTFLALTPSGAKILEEVTEIFQQIC